MRVFILGVNGMLGSVLYQFLQEDQSIEVFGTSRSSLFPHNQENIYLGIDVKNFESVNNLLLRIRPDIIINCVGIIKQLKESNDPLISIPVNSIFPHQLAKVARLLSAKLVHISTDCVFSGNKGNYAEEDIPDSRELYGLSKLLGEVRCDNSLTLRCSLIGPEISHKNGLLSWFLDQRGGCYGYSNAYFNGLTTLEFSKVIRNYIIGNQKLNGIYHIGGTRINKYELLCLIKRIYKLDHKIIINSEFVIDRSLNTSSFVNSTGYQFPGWEEMIADMYNYRLRPLP